MLYRLVRSVKRSDSSLVQFVKRIPDDVLPRAANLKLSIPLGDGEFQHITISPKAQAVRFSLRTRDPSLAKSRQAHVLAYLEEVWRGLRTTKPISLTLRQAHALTGELYRAWASERQAEQTTAITLRPDRSGWDVALACQTARKVAPRSASSVDPLSMSRGEEAARRSWSGLRSRAGSGSLGSRELRACS